MTITVRPTPGIEALQSFLAQLARMGANLRPFMEVAGVIMHDATEESFAGERSPFGAPWQPLAASTAMKFVTKSKRRGYHPILQVTGRLAASMGTEVGTTHVEHGTSVIYAATHQIGRGSIPARPYIGLGMEHLGELEAEALRFAEDYAAQAAERAAARG